MKINKKAISLIVLVITIIVLGVLATTVIISLSNTNIIEQGNNAVNQYNVSQLKQAVTLTEAEFMAAHDGVKPNTFELIDLLEDKEIITAEQKEEMIENDGKLQIGDEVYKADRSTVITVTPSCEKDGSTYKLRFSVDLLKETDDIEYTEYGVYSMSSTKYTSTTGTVEENFTLEGITENGWTSFVRSGKSTDENFRFDNLDNPDWYEYTLALKGLPESNKGTPIMARAYVKYVKDGVEGIIYTNVISPACSDVFVE